MSGRLSGKVCVVTGASGGIGAATVALFRREGDDIVIELPVTLQEAVLGATLEVPTIKGPVRLSIPPNSGTGTRWRRNFCGRVLISCVIFSAKIPGISHSQRAATTWLINASGTVSVMPSSFLPGEKL